MNGFDKTMHQLGGFVLLTLAAAPAYSEDIQTSNVLVRLIDQVDVPARATGSLKGISVSEGTRVTEGDLLGSIDDTEVLLDLERAKFELEIAEEEADNDVAYQSALKLHQYSKAHFERLKVASIAQPKSVSATELEKAQLDAQQAELEMQKGRTQLDQAKLRKKLKQNELAMARRNVEIRKISAPLSGVVVDVYYRPGEWVTPGDLIFRVLRTDRLRAEGFVDANDVVSDLRGKKAVLSPDFGESKQQDFVGSVVFVSPEVEPVNNQIRVLAEFDNPDGILRPGLPAKMTIRTD